MANHTDPAADPTSPETASRPESIRVTPDAAPSAPLDDQAHAERLAQGEAIIRRDAVWALGAGVVPIPGVDVAAVMAVQVKMLRELSDLYGAKFADGIAKKLILSLLGSIGVVGIGGLVGGSLAKLIPGIGTTLGVISVPLLAGAFTQGLGRVLLMHLESGGTLLDFDPVAMRHYFQQEFEKSKQTVAELRKDVDKTAPRAP